MVASEEAAVPSLSNLSEALGALEAAAKSWNKKLAQIQKAAAAKRARVTGGSQASLLVGFGSRGSALADGSSRTCILGTSPISVLNQAMIWEVFSSPGMAVADLLRASCVWCVMCDLCDEMRCV